MSALRHGVEVARRSPALLIALAIVLVAPPLLGMLPLDRALLPLLDLRPAARSLVTAPADDSLFRELIHLAPTLPGTLVGSTLIALLLGVPAMWLIEAFVAARAVDAQLPPNAIAGRGLGVALIALPLRSLPICGAAALVMGAIDARTLAAALVTLVPAALIYAVGSSAVAVLVDLARGVALVEPARTLPSTIGAALLTAARAPGLFAALVCGELLLGALSAGAIAVTRPLGIFSGGTLVLGLVVIAARAIGSVVLVATAARGAATRSA